MPCYTPLKAFEVIGKQHQKANGKKTILFEKPRDKVTKDINVPCGQCIGCRLKHSITWASRIMHEIQTTPDEKACFITLTYNDRNLPDDYSLNKEHFKDFLKRFRKAIHPQKIRYYMCGEYGDDTWRPHYHAIIFGYDFSEPIEYRKILHPPRVQMQSVPTENAYYLSDFLAALWDKGNHVIAEANYDTAAYVARYATKKVNGHKADDHYNRFIWEWNEYTGEIYNMQEVQLQPEYATMSRGRKEPGQTGSGIGSAWYQKYKTDCYPKNYLSRYGNKLPIPKYYDRLLEQENPALLEEMKVARELSLINHKDDLTPEMLAIRHKAKKKQSETLRRNRAC